MGTEHLIAFNKSRSVDWDSVDWTLNNREIAQQVGRSYDTVAKKRVSLGKSGMAVKRATRRRLKEHYNIFRPSAEVQRMATEAAKRSSKAGKGSSNVHAKRWRLISPDNMIYEFTNLYEFVRTHTHLFSPQDVVFKRQGGRRGTGGEYCNATNGLANAVRNRAAWKGWTGTQI